MVNTEPKWGFLARF